MDAEVDTSRLEEGWDEATFSAERNERRRQRRLEAGLGRLNEKLRKIGFPTISIEDIERMLDLDVEPSKLGLADSENYNETFFEGNPDLRGRVWVHHAVEQRVRNWLGGQLKPGQIHSIENLRGIPIELNPELHLSVMRMTLNILYQRFDNARSIEMFSAAGIIDRLYGHLFLPPLTFGPEGKSSQD